MTYFDFEHHAQDRPLTRGACVGGPRPYPWTTCHYHLWPCQRSATMGLGRQVEDYEEVDPWEMSETCALDVADRGGVTLEEVGRILGVTRERVRQIESLAIRKLKQLARWEAAVMELRVFW